MNEITVTNQTELDAIPLDYHGRIYVKFGTPSNPAILGHAVGKRQRRAVGKRPSG